MVVRGDTFVLAGLTGLNWTLEGRGAEAKSWGQDATAVGSNVPFCQLSAPLKRLQECMQTTW